MAGEIGAEEGPTGCYGTSSRRGPPADPCGGSAASEVRAGANGERLLTCPERVRQRAKLGPMGEDQTIGALFRAKAISEDEVDAAVTSCVTGPPDEAFVFAGIYLVNLAAAVQAVPHARERLSDPNASEFLKRIAV
ncbi:hypothetical protein, partial [Methylobacterium nigriterrae]|uniref:hypothetical protein n=1 Tax=Methylobacterium nigriterrae TaxID=3127512 RepID=UPI003013F5F2